MFFTKEKTMSKYIIFTEPGTCYSTQAWLEQMAVEVAKVIFYLPLSQNYVAILENDTKAQTFARLKGKEVGAVFMSIEGAIFWQTVYEPLFDEFLNLTERISNREGGFKQINELLTQESKKIFDLWNQLHGEKEYSPELPAYFFSYGWIDDELDAAYREALDLLTQQYTITPH